MFLWQSSSSSIFSCHSFCSLFWSRIEVETVYRPLLAQPPYFKNLIKENYARWFWTLSVKTLNRAIFCYLDLFGLCVIFHQKIWNVPITAAFCGGITSTVCVSDIQVFDSFQFSSPLRSLDGKDFAELTPFRCWVWGNREK